MQHPSTGLAPGGRCKLQQRSRAHASIVTPPGPRRARTPLARRVRARVSLADPPITSQDQAAHAPGSGSIRPSTDLNQHIREGHYEASLVQQQAGKRDEEQPPLASRLPLLDPTATSDVLVAGGGPAGLFLAHHLAQRGLSVALVGPDGPFVNNYGVWVDEFKALGLQHTLERSWPDALCYFQEGAPTRVGRAYARVSRRLLREHLVGLCAASGVRYLDAQVTATEVAPGGMTTLVQVSTGATLTARLVTLASGAAAGRLLRYESGAPSVAAQTAYGIEAEVEGYEEVYGGRDMLFMDFRRHHTGLWEGTARKLTHGKHPNSGEGMWGTSDEVPSFLYAMPLGGSRVFLEETCLVAKPALPFALLKRRLERRLAAAGIRVVSVHEEEWSYIPVGGPLPADDQHLTAFGAAANLVHPATGFSVSRSLREAPAMADAAAAALAGGGVPVAEAARRVWGALWPAERRRQAAFHVFGMELLTQLDLASTNAFFSTFFALPPRYWRGFLGSSLSSADLLAFAALTFVWAPPTIKARLVTHLLSDPAGGYLIRHYLGSSETQGPGDAQGPSAALASAALLLAAQAALAEAAIAAEQGGGGVTG